MKKTTAIGLVALALASPASAALPAVAYSGDLGDRILGGFRCVTAHVVAPFGWGAAAGTYVFWNPTTRMCEKGGAPAGPQF